MGLYSFELHLRSPVLVFYQWYLSKIPNCALKAVWWYFYSNNETIWLFSLQMKAQYLIKNRKIKKVSLQNSKSSSKAYIIYTSTHNHCLSTAKVSPHRDQATRWQQRKHHTVPPYSLRNVQANYNHNGISMYIHFNYKSTQFRIHVQWSS